MSHSLCPCQPPTDLSKYTNMIEASMRACLAHQITPSTAVDPSTWTTKEQLRLNFPPHKPPGNAKLRLVGLSSKAVGAVLSPNNHVIFTRLVIRGCDSHVNPGVAHLFDLMCGRHASAVWSVAVRCRSPSTTGSGARESS